MQRALVVVDDVDDIEHLVAEAGRLAAGVGADLRLLHVRTDTEYEQDRRAIQGVEDLETQSYDLDQATEGARQFAADAGSDALADLDVEYEAVGAVGGRAEQILAVAEEHDCDHVFISGRRRSPSGKALFGDTAQQVILNFPGPVTIVTADLATL